MLEPLLQELEVEKSRRPLSQPRHGFEPEKICVPENDEAIDVPECLQETHEEIGVDVSGGHALMLGWDVVSNFPFKLD